jgi:hypothetical protein
MSKTDLVYRIVADSGPFSAELKKAEGQVARFSSQARTNLAQIGTAFAAVGAAALSGLAVMVKESINAADEIGKMSDKLGIATEDLSALGYAAEQNGASLEAFEKGALKLNKSIAAAASSTGTASKMFDELGVSVTDAGGQTRSTNDIFRDLADRFQDMESGAQKSALAQELFGKTGADLIPLLNQGSEGLAAFATEAQELGLIIEGETAQSAALFNDQLDVMNKAVKGVANDIASEMLPVLNAYSAQLVKNSKDNNKAARGSGFFATSLKLVISVGEILISLLRLVGNVVGFLFAQMIDGFAESFRAMTAFGKALVGTGKAVAQLLTGDIQGAVQTANDAIGGFGNALGDGFRRRLALFSSFAKDTVDEATGLGATLSAVWSNEQPVLAQAAEEAVQATADAVVEPLTQAVERQRTTMRQATKTVDEYAQRLERNLGKALDLIKTDAERMAEEILDLDEVLIAGAITQGEYEAAVSLLRDRYDEATIAARQLAEEGARVAESVRTPLEQYQASVEQLDQLLAAGAISQETYGRAVEAAFSQAGLAVEQTEQKVETLGITSRGAAEALWDTFQGALFDPFNASLLDMVANFARALAEMALAAAKQKALEALFGGATETAAGFATGGYVAGPGSSTSDSIPARLSNGEYVMQAAAVRKYGVGFMSAINGMRTPSSTSVPRFAEGGMVGGGGDMSVTNVNFFDARELEDFMQSRKGERVILNVMRRNKSSIPT